jgi:general secretion pathway protein F
MAIFEYTGTDRSGTAVRATVEAESIKAAKQKVKKSGLVLLSIDEKNVSKGRAAQLFPSLAGGGKVNTRTLAVTTRQFASLIKANIPLVDALAALIDQTEHLKLKSVLGDVRQQVNEGISLKMALARHPKVFPPIFINMVESGEASGTLPLVLTRLADFLEAQVRLRQKISSAMTYPLLMAVMGGGLMMGIFIFVIPKIANVFASVNKKLPWYTQFLMDVSFFLSTYWWVLIPFSLAWCILPKNIFPPRPGVSRRTGFS